MKFYNKYREFFVYCFFGFLASVINIFVFTAIHSQFHLKVLFANTVAWLLANIFSFVVTRRFVFKVPFEGFKKLAEESSYFLVSRLLALLIDDIFMVVAVMVLPWSSFVIKIIDQILIGLFNYFSSKIIFNYNNRHLLEKMKQISKDKKEA
ncbi:MULTISPECIES: GtrA family protein [Lactobacillaceae]|uniref:GtrA family protein n=1 Tax=Lactobacillaceae TaxID=33958 RepID=UPI000C1B7784|nr:MULTISPECIES: GtrA family protein [Lactobacillaceae]